LSRPERSIVIFRDHLGRYSETFIYAQAAAFQRFHPVFVGGRFISRVPLQPFETLAANSGGVVGKAREYLFKRWRIAPEMMRQLRAIRPELIHAHFGPDGATAIPFARRLNAPLVVTFHGYDVTEDDEQARQSFYAHRLYVSRKDELKRTGAAFIAVSRFVHDLLVQRGFPEERIFDHYIGIDLDLFTPDPAVPREPVVLFVGRLVERKNCAQLIEAMSSIRSDIPNYRLVIIGDGPDEPMLRAMAAEKLPNTEFLGSQPPAEVHRWMNRAKLFCVPSRTAESGDAETFGMVFAEAMAMGVPVVSYVHGGIPEVVSHGETGFLAPEGDARELAEFIRLILNDDDTWRRMSEAGRPHVAKHFDVRKQTMLLEEFYERVINEHRQRGSVEKVRA